MPPAWVRSLEDCWRWIEQVVEQSGGSGGEDLLVELIEDEVGNLAGILVARQRLFFGRDTFLEFSFLIDHDLAETRYTFQFQRRGGGLIWRKDKHTGHEELGGLEHIHFPSEDRRFRYQPVDLEEAIREALDYANDGRLPRV